MNGLRPAYAGSIIKKTKDGQLSTGQAATKLGVSKPYVNRLKRAYAEKKAAEPKPKKAGRPKWVPGPESILEKVRHQPKKG